VAGRLDKVNPEMCNNRLYKGELRKRGLEKYRLKETSNKKPGAVSTGL